MIRNAPTAEIREMAQAQGMKTLRQTALQKVLEGSRRPWKRSLRVTLGVA